MPDSAPTAEELGAALDALADLEAAKSRHLAAEFRALLHLHDVVGAAQSAEFVALDLAGTLRIGQAGATVRLDDALRYDDALPATLQALSDGQLYVPHARVLLEHTERCSTTVAREVERRVLGAQGALLCPGDLKRLVKRTVLVVEAELDLAETERREQDARARRHVPVSVQPDGMAGLWALLTAEQALAHTAGLDELCRRVAATDRATGVVRTAAQRRADVLTLLPQLVLAGWDGTGPLPEASAGVELVVHTPMATALGLSHEPGELKGYGPISATHVRRLLPDARLRRLVVDATTGQPLHADPTTTTPCGSTDAARRVLREWCDPTDWTIATPGGEPEPVDIEADPVGGLVLVDPAEPHYVPSTGLARFVRLRDPRCTGIGCSCPSDHADLDHLRAWSAGGPTAAHNLRPKSRRCHNAKTHGGWTARQDPDGGTTWRNPHGRTYRRPPPWRPPPEPLTEPVVDAPDPPTPRDSFFDPYEVDHLPWLHADLEKHARRPARVTIPAAPDPDAEPPF